MLNKQPAETASSIADSANLLRSSIENSSEQLTEAVIVSAETAAENAKQIGDQVTLLAGVIMDGWRRSQVRGPETQTPHEPAHRGPDLHGPH